MEFQDVVRRRRMVRSFQDRPVPPDVLERILSNAIRAPSAGFSQGWAFLVLRGEECARFAEVTFPAEERRAFRWTSSTPPVLVVCLSHMDAYLDRYAEPDKGWTDRDPGRWFVPYWHIDTGFAALLMLLTAVDEGLGAVFFGIVGHRTEAFRAEFGVPDGYTPIGAIALGYPAPDEPSPSLRRGRRPLHDVVHWGTW